MKIKNFGARGYLIGGIQSVAMNLHNVGGMKNYVEKNTRVSALNKHKFDYFCKASK